MVRGYLGTYLAVNIFDETSGQAHALVEISEKVRELTSQHTFPVLYPHGLHCYLIRVLNQ